MLVDAHQHLWTSALVDALAARSERPFVRTDHGLTVLHLAGEQPYVIDREADAVERRAALVHLDGVDRALICLSAPLGIESLPRAEAEPLLAAYHDGALALPGEFGVWGVFALQDPRAADIDAAVARGCVGVSCPAGALAGVHGLAALGPALARLEELDAPLLIHPGPAPGSWVRESCLEDPLWWPALTEYVADMQAAWYAFTAVGRRAHPRLRVVFAMLAGLAPLQSERLEVRGGPAPSDDPLSFYDCSSYGARAVAAVADVVGDAQIIYGSDRPVVDPQQLRDSIAEGFERYAGASAELLERRAVAGGAALGTTEWPGANAQIWTERPMTARPTSTTIPL